MLRLWFFVLLLALGFGPAVLAAKTTHSDDDERTEETSAPKKKKKVVSRDDNDDKPAASSKTLKKKSAEGDEEKPASKTSATKKMKSGDEDEEKPATKTGMKGKSAGSKAQKDDEEEAPAKKKSAAEKSEKGDVKKPDSQTDAEKDGTAKPEEAAKSKYAPAASIATTELLGFAEQPERVQKLITDALEMTKLNLTYTFGSDDPGKGGMDCSGAVSYLLKQEGFSEVPRDSAGQYVWARKNGKFFAVVSKKAGGFEFSDMLPGDLMFWSGTYAADRDPPVTHSMIYLGVQRHRGQHVMWGSSDGRSYDGKQRYGVSVFDFKMPRTETKAADGVTPRQVDFLGYARIPGLREARAEGAAESTEEKAGQPKKSEKKTTKRFNAN